MAETNARQMETSLRQAEKRVTVVGIVSEKDLKEVVEDGVTKIKGSVTVKTSDVNFVRFNVNVNEKTKNGTDNRMYAGIRTVMNDYVSIAEVGEDQADKVRVSGEINPFRSNNSGEEIIGYKGNSFRRVRSTDTTPFTPSTEFRVEMFIEAIVPEISSGEETGRILVKGWVPTYNGIEPIVLVADNDTEDQIANAIDSIYEPGQTVMFFGEIVNRRVEKKKVIPVVIGKPKVDTTYSYINDLVITGASEAYEEGVSEEAPYDKATIKAAIQERKNRIEEEANKASTASPRANATTQKPSGASRGRVMNF